MFSSLHVVTEKTFTDLCELLLDSENSPALTIAHHYDILLGVGLECIIP